MADERIENERPVALVTGAGSGIGRAICVLLAREGYCIALVGRTPSRLKETIAAANVADEDALVVAADVSIAEESHRAVDETLGRFGRLDALINNAGAAEIVPIEKTTQDLLDRIFAVNVFGPAHLIARTWPAFVRQGGGCVVNVSSMSAVDPFPGLSMYGAAKSALEGLTRGVLNEGRPLNIWAFTVAPGAVETAMLRSFASESNLPRSAVLEPEEVARVVVDCVTGRREGDVGKVVRVLKMGGAK